MTVDYLIAELEKYAGEQEVKIFDDHGSSYVLRTITNVLESTEFENSKKDPVIALFTRTVDESDG